MTENEKEVLRTEIQEHCALYEKGKPTITDSVFDKMFRKFSELFGQDNSSLTLDKPIDKQTDGYYLFAHKVPMLSLKSIESSKSVDDFTALGDIETEDRVELSCEPKIDGVAVSLRYLHGELQFATTRGDGREGGKLNTCLHSLFPESFIYESGLPIYIEIRGEIYMDFPDDERETATRNVVAGYLYTGAKLPDRILAKLRYCVFGVGECIPELATTQSDLLAKLKSFGFNIPENCIVSSDTEVIKQWRADMVERRPGLSYPIDGVVYKVNNMSFQEQLGSTNAYPRWALAHKFSSREAITVVKEIKIQVSKSGILTPVAHLEPVEITGAIMRRASLHNEKKIRSLDIRVGDSVIVERAKDVIPNIVSVCERQKGECIRPPFEFPSHCPICGSDVVKFSGKHICSGGYSCKAQVTGLMVHMMSSHAFDVYLLSGSRISQLVDAGIIKTPVDIFLLKNKSADMLLLDGWKEARVHGVLRSIANKKTIPLSRFIYALGIKAVGEGISGRVASHVGSYNIFHSVLNSEEDMNKYLSHMPGVGAHAVAALRNFGSNSICMKYMEEIASVVDISDYSDVD